MRLFGFNIERERRSTLENPQVSIDDPAALAFLLGDAFGSSSGVHVTVERALGVPAVWAAVNFLSDTLASLPIHVFDGQEKLSGDPLVSILHDAPNPELTSFDWRKWLMSVVLTTGRAVTFIDRSPSGRVLNLWPVEPGNVSVERVNGRLLYRAHDNGQSVTYGAEDVLDVKFLGTPDLVGHRSPVHTLRDTLGLAIALEGYASRFFQGGGVPPLQLVGPFQSPQGAERAGFDIGKAIAAVKKKGGNVLPLPIGHELKQIGFDPDKSQMTEARRMQIEEIARIYGLPPVFIQDLSRATFSNAEQQDLTLVKHTISHWVSAIEQELNLKLFGRDSSRYVKFNLDGLLRGDHASRMTGHATSITNAIRTPNEVRALENLPSIEGGDKLLVQGAMIPVETAGEKPEPAPAPVVADDQNEDTTDEA